MKHKFFLQIEGRLFGSDISGWTNISHQHVDHYMEATIAGWQYEEERFMTKVQQTIKVNIVEIKVCEDNLKTSYLKSDKLMCGVPFCENQLVTQVINLMHLINFKTFCLSFLVN